MALLRWEQLEPTELPGSKLYTGYSSVITREYTLLAFHHLYKFFWGQNQFHVPDEGGQLKWCECWTSLRPGVAQPRQVTCDGLSSRQTFPSATNTWQGTRGAYSLVYFYQMCKCAIKHYKRRSPTPELQHLI